MEETEQSAALTSTAATAAATAAEISAALTAAGTSGPTKAGPSRSTYTTNLPIHLIAGDGSSILFFVFQPKIKKCVYCFFQ